jgi:hypothetical protein
MPDEEVSDTRRAWFGAHLEKIPLRPGENLAMPVELGLELALRRYHCNCRMPAVTAKGSDFHSRVRETTRGEVAGKGEGRGQEDW